MKAEYVLLACAVVVCVALAVSAASSVAFLRRLKRHEHDVYLSLGSPLTPGPYVVAHLRRSAEVLLFLKQKSHRSLRDERSARLGDIAVVANRALLWVIAAACAISFYIILFVRP